jgi:hypothetical protein
MKIKGYIGKMITVSELALNSDRTCIGRFLDSKSWNDKYLLKMLNEHVITRIWTHSKETGLPIYLIIDDTICEKTLPSSKAKRPIAGCGFHKSHIKNEFVYGHQFVSAMLRCGDMLLPFTIALYERERKEEKDKKDEKNRNAVNDTIVERDTQELFQSKIEIAETIIKSLPKPINKGYVLTDSWYSSITLFKASRAAEFHFIGAIKGNRKIFPKKYRLKGISISTLVRTLNKSDFDVVTISGHRYYAYTYLGKINGINKVKIVITYPVNALFVDFALKAFISTDIKMNCSQLLKHYAKRWPIEVFFREANRRLGMKQCQVSSKKAILRYQYLVMLTYIYCGLDVDGQAINFSKQHKKYQKDIECFKIEWIAQRTKEGFNIVDILKEFKLVA